jgi:archaeal type IV pilus assembly protein PilA
VYSLLPYSSIPKGGIKEKMNTLRKMRKNAKALSPVVASIILIAVTVAVSIAVAAWMGALVVGNMNTEELKITNAQFADLGANVVLTVKNTGASEVVLTDAYIGSDVVTTSTQVDPGTGTYVAIGAAGTAIKPNTVVLVQITPTAVFESGTAYQFKLLSAKGNAFVYTGTAPL